MDSKTRTTVQVCICFLQLLKNVDWRFLWDTRMLLKTAVTGFSQAPSSATMATTLTTMAAQAASWTLLSAAYTTTTPRSSPRTVTKPLPIVLRVALSLYRQQTTRSLRRRSVIIAMRTAWC
eukprot:Rmarinus@m.24418